MKIIHADAIKLELTVNYTLVTELEKGVSRFVEWWWDTISWRKYFKYQEIIPIAIKF